MKCIECQELTGHPERPGATVCEVTGAQISAAARVKERDCDNEEFAAKFHRRVARRKEIPETKQPEVSQVALAAAEVQQGGTEIPKGKHDDQVMDMWSQGLRVGQIAAQIKYSSEGVVRILERHQIPREEIEERWLRKPRRSAAQTPRAIVTQIPSAAPVTGPASGTLEELIDERQFHLDEEAESPDAGITRFDDWVNGGPVQRMAAESLVIGQAIGLEKVIIAMYGKGPEAAILLHALRQVTDMRLERLKEAS